MARLSVLGATVVLLSACGLVLGIPGADEVKNDYGTDGAAFDGAAPDAANVDSGPEVGGGDGGLPEPLLSVSTFAPIRLALDGSGNLFFIDYTNSQIVGINLGTKNFTVILPKTTGLDTLHDIAASPGYVFFTNYQAQSNDGKIVRCAATGCGGTKVDVSIDVGYPSDIELDGTTLYASYYDGMLRKAPNATTGTTALAWTKILSTPAPTQMAEQGGEVFWTDTNNTNLYKCGASTCPDNPSAFAVGSVEIPALDTTHVYWLERGLNDISAIYQLPRGGGTKATIVEKQPWIYTFAVDPAGNRAGNVYFGTRDASISNKGQVLRCPKTGCITPTVLVDGVDINDVVLDATYVYYAAGSNVYRLPR